MPDLTPSKDEKTIQVAKPVAKTPEVQVERNHEADARERAAIIRDKLKGRIGNLQQRLPVIDDRPGWKRRWVLTSNIPGRLAEGYTFVKQDQTMMLAEGLGYGNQDIGDRIATHAGRGSIDPNGKQEMLYLMEVPLEIAKLLDYEKSGKQTAANMAALKAGNSGGHVKADHHAYIPTAGITVKN